MCAETTRRAWTKGSRIGKTRKCFAEQYKWNASQQLAAAAGEMLFSTVFLSGHWCRNSVRISTDCSSSVLPLDVYVFLIFIQLFTIKTSISLYGCVTSKLLHKCHKYQITGGKNTLNCRCCQWCESHISELSRFVVLSWRSCYETIKENKAKKCSYYEHKKILVFGTT